MSAGKPPAGTGKPPAGARKPPAGAGKPPAGTGKPPAGAEPSGDAPAPRPCPICGRPPVERYRPFCSKRCADVDLNRWLSGSYAIAGRDDEDEDGDPASGREG